MKKILLFLFSIPFFFTSCIKDPAPNAEADIITFSFSEDAIRTKSEVSNNEVVNFPKLDVQLQDSTFEITITPGATWQRIDKTGKINDTLFFIKVTSEDQKSVKIHTIRQVRAFPSSFPFEEWVKVDKSYNFQNPKEIDVQFFSSNNGVAMAWAIKGFTPTESEYPAHKTTDCVGGLYAAELITKVGPGKILDNRFIPCIAGSLYTGGFDALKGLTNPLQSTQFGVPYDNGKPTKLKGYYKYKEGTEDYIFADGSTDKTKHDSCDIYAVLFDASTTPFLHGDDIKNSPLLIAKAQIPNRGSTSGEGFHYFEVNFDYDSYPSPFNPADLLAHKYKMALVFTSSTRGAYYEGRPGSKLVVDNLHLEFDEIKNLSK